MSAWIEAEVGSLNWKVKLAFAVQQSNFGCVKMMLHCVRCCRSKYAACSTVLEHGECKSVFFKSVNNTLGQREEKRLCIFFWLFSVQSEFTKQKEGQL